MYKRATRALLHAHRVNAPLPTGGYIGTTGTVEDDFIASAGNMSLAECKAELGRLSVELAQANNQLQAAKTAGKTDEVRRLGNLIQTLGQRRNPFRQRIHIISQQNDEQALAQAVREIVPEDIRQLIYARQHEIRDRLARGEAA